MADNEAAIEVRELRKSYGAAEVLKGIDLKVERETAYAILGPNGAGKPTSGHSGDAASAGRRKQARVRHDVVRELGRRMLPCLMNDVLVFPSPFCLSSPICSAAPSPARRAIR